MNEQAPGLGFKSDDISPLI